MRQRTVGVALMALVGGVAGMLLITAGASAEDAKRGSAASIRIDLEGTGEGQVVSTPTGIDCPGKCVELGKVGQQYTLTATPAAGSAFAGFVGNNFPCESAGATTCTFTAQSGSNSFSATFDLASAGGGACDKAKAKLAKAKQKVAKLKADGASAGKIKTAKAKVKKAKAKKKKACAA